MTTAIAAVTRSQQQYRPQRNPAANGVHNNRAGKVVEAGTKLRFQPALKAVVAIPDDTFKERIHHTNDQQRGAQLRRKLGPFGNTTGDDRRNGCGKGHQEEELHQRVTVVLRQGCRIGKEGSPIGNPVADKEIGKTRNREITDDFRQRVYLILLPNRTYLKKRKTGVHGQNHDRAHQNKQGVCTVDQGFHSTVQVFHSSSLYQVRKCTRCVRMRDG